MGVAVSPRKVVAAAVLALAAADLAACFLSPSCCSVVEKAGTGAESPDAGECDDGCLCCARGASLPFVPSAIRAVVRDETPRPAEPLRLQEHSLGVFRPPRA